MNSHITALAHWFSKKLNILAAVLDDVGRPVVTQSKFVDLAPTDQADKTGVYSEALLYATSNAKVSNIALTGPYGSGKSSIIQSFLKKYQRPALHISLAAFVPEAEAGSGKITRQEIERSILQQMLYGADADKLPLSRFKRIQSPGFFSVFRSLYIMLGLLALGYVFLQREAVVSGAYFTPLDASNWYKLACFALAAIFLWMTLHHFYVASFGVSLKSISLKDIEIRPASDNQESILNRHLDEIIYFFQSTKYDLVVIEDLDRFNNTEIFVTLREINSLVNENVDVKRRIRFLYALRDDIFVNTDRTKFFEFIVPVIPIINASNSIDMVLAQGKRLALDGRLDAQFLREVSRYLDDLRLIQNIFNEYAVYVANLEADDENLLDTNKLLAILIYKNVYPRDFEHLHRGEGNLATILNRKDDLIAHSEAAHRSEIAELEQAIEVAERQTPHDLKELRQIYAMALFEKLPEHVVSVSLDGHAWVVPSQITAHEAFEGIIAASHLYYRTIHGHQQRFDISGLQAEIDARKSYVQRKAEIEGKLAANKNESLRRIRELRAESALLRTAKFNILVRLNADRLNDLFDGFGEKGELARFLILEGHLDDSYYQYTSLFHSGRLSPSDNKFLIQIRAFVTPEPDLPIDNPKEVIAAMRDEDFGQSYVLNIKLVDCILADQARYADHASKLFKYLSSEFESSEGFFEAYYGAGSDVSALLSGLAAAWRGFVPTAIASPRNISHVTQLIRNLPERSLQNLANEVEDFPSFVATNLPEILAHAPDLAPERLECVHFEIDDFGAIREHSSVARFMFEKGLFKLTVANLEYIYQDMLQGHDVEALRTRNYTTLRSANDAVLMNRIERDFEVYLKDVLLGLPENGGEDAPAILAVIRRDELDTEDLWEFLGKQESLLPSLDEVPEKLHPMLFQLQKIQPTWANCLAFINSDSFDTESLVDFLDDDEVRAAIANDSIPAGVEMLPLWQFLIGAAALSDAAYREYARMLPTVFSNFPEGIEYAKLRALIQEGRVAFGKDSFDALDEHADLQILFVAANIASYLADADAFALDDDVHEELLGAEIDTSEKRAIVDLMDLSALAERPERAALIGPIVDRANASIPQIDASAVQALIVHSRPVATQISLFNKCQALLSDEEVRYVLANLPDPFSEIATGHYYVRLPNSPEGLALAAWLDNRNIISSWSQGGFLTDDIRVNLYRR